MCVILFRKKRTLIKCSLFYSGRSGLISIPVGGSSPLIPTIDSIEYTSIYLSSIYECAYEYSSYY